MCWSLGAQAQWAVAEWAQRQGKSGLLALRVGLPMAKKAMEDPRLNPDGWQVLAETHLRLAQAVGKDRRARSESIDAGLSACARALGINPRHPLALQTRGALRLMQGATESTDALRKQRGTEALADLRTAAAHDAMLGPHHQALMAEAMKLASTTK